MLHIVIFCESSTLLSDQKYLPGIDSTEGMYGGTCQTYGEPAPCELAISAAL